MCFTDEPGASALDEEFAGWLERYRDGELGGLLTAAFLTREHLMAAFAAGWAARAEREEREITRVREAGYAAWDQREDGAVTAGPASA